MHMYLYLSLSRIMEQLWETLEKLWKIGIESNNEYGLQMAVFKNMNSENYKLSIMSISRKILEMDY